MVNKNKSKRDASIVEAVNEFYGESETSDYKGRIIAAITKGTVKYLEDKQKSEASLIQANLEA